MNFLVFALLVMGASATPNYDTGLSAYTAGKYEDALRSLEAAEKAGEDAPELPYYLGVCFVKNGKWVEGGQRLAPYAAAHPDLARAWYWLAQAQHYSRQFAEARTSIERVLKLEPKSAEAYRTLGEIQLGLKDFDGAYRSWVTANQLNPKDQRTTYYLGRLFLEADFLEEAAAWLRETLRLAPKHFGAMNYLGICAERLAMQDTALKLYRTSISESKQQLSPFPWAYLNLAKLLRQMGRDAEAFALLEEAERLCPEGHALSMLGQMLSARNQAERAEAVLRRAVELDPSIPDAHYSLAMVLRGSGRIEEAQAEIQRFLEAKQVEEKNKPRILAARKGK